MTEGGKVMEIKTNLSLKEREAIKDTPIINGAFSHQLSDCINLLSGEQFSAYQIAELATSSFIKYSNLDGYIMLGEYDDPQVKVDIFSIYGIPDDTEEKKVFDCMQLMDTISKEYDNGSIGTSHIQLKDLITTYAIIGLILDLSNYPISESVKVIQGNFKLDFNIKFKNKVFKSVSNPYKDKKSLCELLEEVDSYNEDMRLRQEEIISAMGKIADLETEIKDNYKTISKIQYEKDQLEERANYYFKQWMDCADKIERGCPYGNNFHAGIIMIKKGLYLLGYRQVSNLWKKLK